MIVFAVLMAAIVWFGATFFIMITGTSGASYLHALWVHFSGNCFNWPILFHDLNVFWQWARICVKSAFHCKVDASGTG